MPKRSIKSLLARLPEPVFGDQDWPDYSKLGLVEGDFEELVDLASNFYLFEQQSDEQSARSIHAWRAMAELDDSETLSELMTLSIECDLIEDEWFAADFPRLLGRLGMQTVILLREMVDEHPEFPSLAEGLVLGLPEMVRNSEDRTLAIDSLVTLLDHRDFDRSLRALVVGSLIKLEASETAEAIREQFVANRIDVSLQGDWEEVALAFGLRKKRETARPDFSCLEAELALQERKALVGEFPEQGGLDDQLHYFLLRYQNAKSIRRLDELDGYLLACVLANPHCSTEQASYCVWDTLDASEDWQPTFESDEEGQRWERCLEQVLARIKDGLRDSDYEPYVLVWPDAEGSMDPEAPFFTPWLEGFLQGELAFFDEGDRGLSSEIGPLVEQVFEREAEGIRLLEDQDDNPIFLIMAEIMRRYRGEDAGGEFSFFADAKKAWLAPELRSEQANPTPKKEVARNAACPCGSGLKYKKCCLN